MKKAMLDDRGRLVGAKAVKKLGEDEHDPGDLPLDGSYKFDAAGKAFIPVGHGFGKVQQRAPYGSDYVLALMVEHAGNQAPPAAREWLGWYNETMREREEEKH